MCVAVALRRSFSQFVPDRRPIIEAAIGRALLVGTLLLVMSVNERE